MVWCSVLSKWCEYIVCLSMILESVQHIGQLVVFNSALKINCLGLPYSDVSLSPCHWKTSQQHDLWWAELVPFKHECLESRFTRPENLVSQSLWVLYVLFCKFHVCFHVSSLRRGLSLATPPLKHRLMECCSDVLLSTQPTERKPPSICALW